MFQKKVPGYRNGGGIAYLANGGRPNIPVSGERIRIKPSTVKPPSGPSIPTNRSLIVNPVDETLKKLDRQRFGDQFKGLNFKDKFKKGIGSIKDFTKKAAMPTVKTLGRGLGLGTLLYNVAPVPSFRLGESNPIRNLDIDPSAGAIFRGRGNNLIGGPGAIGSYDALREIDREIQEIESLGDNITPTDIRRLEQLRKNKDMATSIVERPLVDFVAGKDRSVLDNTIDTIVSQLTSGTAARLSGAKLGEINTAKGVADILDKNRDQLVELMQEPGNAGLAKELAPKFSTPEGLKEIAKMLDIEAYEKIFPAEVVKEVKEEIIDPDEKAKQDAIQSEKQKDLDLALKNQKASRILAENRAIAGNTLDPKIEEKALLAAAYGGGPDATAFDYVKNADLARIAEEEKADKFALERAKAMGTGYSDKPRTFEIGKGINISIYDPTARGVQQGKSPFITDTDYIQASSQFETAIKNSTDISNRINELERLLEEEDLTSAFSFVSSLGSRAANLLNISADSTPQQKYNAIAKAVQAYFTKDFLQESGRTISNIDRELVNSIFPTIGPNETGFTEASLLQKLKDAREQISQKQETFGRRLNDLGLYNPKMAAKYTQSNLSAVEEKRLEELREKQG